ncbi:MAG: hypothetical protein ACI33P_13235 [Lysinibacillus sp.]
MFRIASDTSIAGSLFITIMLKMLHLFKWIKWHPTKFLHIVDDGLTRWIVLFVILYVASFIFFMIVQYIQKVPAFLTAIILGLAIAFVAEWIIYDLPAEAKSFKRLSIPFIVVVVTTSLFLTETATYHRAHLGKRNELPYKASVIK